MSILSIRGIAGNEKRFDLAGVHNLRDVGDEERMGSEGALGIGAAKHYNQK